MQYPGHVQFFKQTKIGETLKGSQFGAISGKDNYTDKFGMLCSTLFFLNSVLVPSVTLTRLKLHIQFISKFLDLS